MLIDERGPLEAMPVLKTSEMFYNRTNRLIFEAIRDLSYNNQAIDLLTVADKLRTQNKLQEIGGEYTLVQLTQKSGSSAHIEHHCRILAQYWLKRKLIQKADKIRQMAFLDDTDSLELLEEDARMNDEISEVLFTGTKQTTYADALTEVEQRVEMLSHQKEGEFTGVPTGFKKLDKFTGGWQPSDLIIIAARPGMGKTAFILKNTVECGLRNVPVGFFSLEMSTTQLAARTVAINSNFHLSQLIRDGFEKDKYFATLRNRTDEMRKFPVFIDDTPSLDIRDIVSKARIWKRKHDIKILFVDYIQLASDRTKGNNREQEIASISRNLKMLAKELNIPVIALSQLSRNVETRTDKHPKLSDLRESGAIEQDADIVTFLYREHYYNPGIELPYELSSIGANAEFNFAKYRSGSLETKGLYFDANKVKYMDPEEYEADIVHAIPNINPKDDNPF
jgi:replicative DNA helicase